MKTKKMASDVFPGVPDPRQAGTAVQPHKGSVDTCPERLVEHKLGAGTRGSYQPDNPALFQDTLPKTVRNFHFQSAQLH